ncbi:MAG: PA2778 family cysteine peptidase [Nitrospinaceae bacterium]|nr:PA2778 family cysteine peptidase [Nitrospinaceae bacterium]NIR54801.1 PA2778 family cysteine peptidase [Nitrospinaceae bacterium]NIT82039.1 PA2778 family cysteine peptidase [Nitrospinaceae bacterium]NIW05895.1 PA2778 family cysteine peptidase [Nitrospinaceae bacterium]NIW59065.1 PA2778 family cysteine peptidase [Nitrospinaceae bacterium]
MGVRWILAAGLWLAGCATSPPPSGLPDSLDVSSRHELTEVPFFPQRDYQCGPASLAMTLAWSGLKVTPEDLKPQVYSAKREGSLPPDMIAAARRRGRIAYPVTSTADLLREVAAGHPVIVLQRLESFWQTQWHYAVVIGYDLERREIVLHSGAEERLAMALDAFEQTWKPWGYWGLVTMDPRRLPASAEPKKYVKAVLGLERTQRWQEAEQAYSSALARWPHHLTAWIGLGNSRYALGNLAGAEQAFRSAVRAKPDSGIPYNNLAHVLMEMNRTEEALAVIRQAIRLGGPQISVYKKTLAEIQRRRNS